MRQIIQRFRQIKVKAIAVLPFYLFTFLPLTAQVGTWKNYLSYYEIQQIQAAGDDIFVRASNSLYQYNQKDQSITTYDKVNGLSDTQITHIAWNKQAKRLIAVYQNSNIDLVETNGNITNVSDIYSKTMTEDKTVNNIYINGKYAYLSCGFGIIKVNVADAEIAETYNLGYNVTAVGISNDMIYARLSDSSVISASMNTNLIDPNNWTTTSDYPSDIFNTDTSDYHTYYPIISTLKPGGPKYNYFGFMKYKNNRLYTSGGCPPAYRIPGCIQVLNNNEWQIYQDENISEQTGISYINIASVDVDPLDDSHLFAASRSGLYEFKNGNFVKLYNDENSPIESFNGSSKSYEMILGLTYQQNGTLWFLNSQAPTQSLIEYTTDGQFVSHHIPEVMVLDAEGYKGKSLGNLSRPIFDSKGYLWFVNNHFINASLYRYDISNKSTITYSDFTNQDGTAITAMYAVTCATEDKQGNMWIGTDVGPFVLEKSQIEAQNPYYTQVKIPRNDGTNYADYLLNKVSITDICIDEANRKWIATDGDGVYLISEDNLTQLQHFTKDNSKLLSNSIQSLAINNSTGEVFFGSESGLCSYVSDATTINEDMTTDNVWAYPNPVTPDYTGMITIVGLSYNADIKIVSSNGVLVAEGKSNGGSFTWDGNDKKGHRVASGIYMVITAKQDGSKGTVCKIAIVN